MKIATGAGTGREGATDRQRTQARQGAKPSGEMVAGLPAGLAGIFILQCVGPS